MLIYNSLIFYMGFSDWHLPSHVITPHFGGMWVSMQHGVDEGFDVFMVGDSIARGWSYSLGNKKELYTFPDPAHMDWQYRFKGLIPRRAVQGCEVDYAAECRNPVLFSFPGVSDMGTDEGFYNEEYSKYDCYRQEDRAATALLVEMNEVAMEVTQAFYQGVFASRERPA